MTEQTAIATQNASSDVPMNWEQKGTKVNPTNMHEVVEFAKIMSKADIALPQHLRANVGACLAVAMQAMDWEMSPFAVAAKSYVVKGAIAYEAQLIAAVVNTRSGIEGRLKYSYDGEGENLTCTVTGKLDGEEYSYTSPPIGAITTKNSPLWKADPQQQLGYYSSRSWARRYTPEVILGVYDRDEAQSFKDVTPPASGVQQRLEAAQETATDSQTEGFGTVDIPEHQNTNSDAEAPPTADAEEGEVEAGHALSGTPSPTEPLGHLPGEWRRKVQAFAKAYFGGMSADDREQVNDEWKDLRAQHEDVSAAMDSIIQMVAMKEIDQLMEFTGLDEAELKEAA